MDGSKRFEGLWEEAFSVHRMDLYGTLREDYRIFSRLSGNRCVPKSDETESGMDTASVFPCTLAIKSSMRSSGSPVI